MGQIDGLTEINDMSEQNYGMAGGKTLGSATTYCTTFCKAYSFVIIDGR